DVQHNNLVRKNRDIMRRFIDVVCFLSGQEMAFRGHDESRDSLKLNKGNYVELVKLLSEYDEKLKYHLEHSTTFTGMSNLIQNDLIASISNILMDRIKREINESNFISIVLDEATDVSNFSQLSPVFRYVTERGQVHERFLGLINVSNDRTAEALYKIVVQLIHNFGCEKKLIAQSYDGAAVMVSQLNGLQSRTRVLDEEIKKRFSNLDSLLFLELLNVKNFDMYKHCFPEIAFQSLKDSYGNVFEFSSLRSQLVVTFISEDMRHKSVSDLLKFIRSNDLQTAYCEVVKLCELTLTIPATSASVERSFSTLKRIKNYVRNSQGQERLTNLAVLSIERGLLKQLKQESTFYDLLNSLLARQ
ncbi:hypothetical protein L9F63_000046, partial [Diploptera punctata]